MERCLSNIQSSLIRNFTILSGLNSPAFKVEPILSPFLSNLSTTELSAILLLAWPGVNGLENSSPPGSSLEPGVASYAVNSPAAIASINTSIKRILGDDRYWFILSRVSISLQTRFAYATSDSRKLGYGVTFALRIFTFL